MVTPAIPPADDQQEDQMKKALALLALLTLAVRAAPALAQLQGGAVAGVVRDQQGAALPGATVTLSGADATRTFITTDDGRYRFLNVPPGTYRFDVTLQGFKSIIREQIVVVVGINVAIDFTLSLAAVAESITVTGESPIIDPKAMGTATNFTQNELSRVPNSRDPWALLRTVPGVVLDRVNIAGNETGQQSQFVSKGTRPQDTVWVLDGVVITDQAAAGASPTYFDYDAFDEIQISTAGNDIRQPTGGAGLNFVVKRGTNLWKGTLRGYFTSDDLEASNVPAELRQRGVTPATADHNDQITDYGFDVGGPIARDRAWIWGSWTEQDIRLIRQAGALVDRTLLKTSNVKANWQVTKRDMVSVLWFNGAKEKYGRAVGFEQLEPASARWNQGNFTPENRLPGLLKFEDSHTFGANLFVTAKYAYYATGFKLEPAGGMEAQAGRSTVLGQTFGSTLAQRFLRPQHTVAIDANRFATLGGAAHDLKIGGSYRRNDAYSQAIWPGNMILSWEVSATDRRARVFREGAGTNRIEQIGFYIGDTISTGRATIEVGTRFDRQWGAALPSSTQSNKGLPAVVPGIEFAGYEAPFTWNDLSPRAGVTWGLDDARRTIARASFNRQAGQISTGVVGFMNPTAAAGFADYRWADRNGDRFAQTEEVLLDQFLSSGGGFNRADPTAVRSANLIDPNLRAPKTTAIVAGLDRELMPNLAVQVSYSWTRTDDFTYTPLIGFAPADYVPGPAVTGRLPDGSNYSVPTFVPNAAKAAAVGNGRALTNYDGYYWTFHGVEAAVVKRMSNRWMLRAAGSYNNTREFYDQNPPRNNLGGPTRTDTNPLQAGPISFISAGSGAGDVFIHRKWQLNVNGAYGLPGDVEIAGNLFGQQGTPYPYFQAASLGADGVTRVIVTPELDTSRFDDVWNLDLRVAKHVRAGRLNVLITGDVFNVFNVATELNRQRNIASPVFGVLTQNLSPRILRVGVRIGF